MTLIAEARLRGARSQSVFDVVLRTLAEPGSIRQLPDEVMSPRIPPSLWLPLALADVDVGVYVDPALGVDMDRLIADATRCRLVGVGDADVAALGTADAPALASLRRGVRLAPELAARVAIRVDALSADTPDAVPVTVAGPGVPGDRTLWVAGLSPQVLAGLGQASGPFPTGLDTWLFDSVGRVAAIARTTAVTVQEG